MAVPACDGSVAIPLFSSYLMGLIANWSQAFYREKQKTNAMAAHVMYCNGTVILSLSVMIRAALFITFGKKNDHTDLVCNNFLFFVQ